jgi:hypothetical protein
MLRESEFVFFAGTILPVVGFVTIGMTAGLGL